MNSWWEAGTSDVYSISLSEECLHSSSGEKRSGGGAILA